MLFSKGTVLDYFGNFELKKYLFYVIPFLFSGLILGFIYLNLIYEYKTDTEFSLENRIDIEYAYTKNPGRLSVLGFSDERDTSRHPMSFSSSEVLKPLTTTVYLPYQHSHEIIFSFDAGVDQIILHGIYVNNAPVDLKKFTETLILRNFDSIVYSEEYDSLLLGISNSKNQIRFSDSVLKNIPKITKSEEEKLLVSIENEKFKEKLVVLFLFLALFFLLSFLFIRAKLYKFLCWLYLAMFFIAVDFSFAVVIKRYLLFLNGGDIVSNLNKFHINYMPVFFFLLFLPLSVISGLHKFYLKLIFVFVPVITFIILIGDNFIISVLDSRFIFSGSGVFFKQANYSVPFIIKYFKSDEGIAMLSAVVMFIFVLILSFRADYRIRFKPLLLLSVLVLGYSLYPVSLAYNDYKFSNVFQINNFSFVNRGNYHAAYSRNYEPLKTLDYKWTVKQGLNSGKNVIVILVESLDCSLTFACGSSQELAPNITKLASENLFFDHYYSNNFNTHAAYLTVVKSIPFFPPKNMEFSDSLLHLYNQNDLVASFRRFGYEASFFSSTDLVYGMDATVALSVYDHIYTENDPYFDNIKERFVFNSVPDENLFDYLAYRAKNESKPFIYITKTASSHAPFSSPYGLNDFNRSFQYTDEYLGKFVERLEQDGFFKNGILVITGDHKAWDNQHGDFFEISSGDGNENFNAMESNHVPLIIIDGTHDASVNHTYFSHSSLGVYIQSLILPEYKLNRYSADVAFSTEPETILYYENEKRNYVIVKIGEVEAEVMLNGDNSEFLQHVFDEETEKAVLGYIAGCKVGDL